MAELTQAALKELEAMIEIDPEPEFVETGNIGFDMAISNGKGLPMGYSILFWGKQGCGKTTLFADVALRLLKKHKDEGEPFKVLYIDVEGSTSLLLNSELGSGLKEFYLSHDFLYPTMKGKNFTWSQIELFYEAALNDKGPYKDVKLIVIDSINNVLSDQNVKNSVTAGDFGTKAKDRSNFWAKYLPLCKQKGISTFMVSQARTKQNALVGTTTEKPAGSFSDFHNADVILKCVNINDQKDASKAVVKSMYGETKDKYKFIMILDPTAEMSKNRIDRTYKCEVLLQKGLGALNYYSLRKMLVFHHFLKENGAWYSFPKELVEGLKLPDKKLNREDVNKVIKDNAGDLVAFLKKMDCYSPVAKDEEVEEISGSEGEDEEEVTDETEGDEE